LNRGWDSTKHATNIKSGTSLASSANFREDRYVHEHEFNRTGTACRENDGNWHFR
jgi:surface antigen